MSTTPPAGQNRPPPPPFKKTPLKKTSTIPISMIFPVLIPLGLALAAIAIAPLGGGALLGVGFFPGLAVMVSQYAWIPLTIFTLASAGYLGYIGWERHNLRKESELNNPGLYLDHSIGTVAESARPRVETTPEVWQGRVEGAPRARNYDLTTDGQSGEIAQRTNDNLRIPHVANGQIEHDITVRLPASQLGAFHESIGTFLKDIESPELFFMVFNNQDEVGEFEFSLHAMVLDNYNDGEARRGQKVITDRQGDRIGLQTTMKIAMCDTVGIDREHSLSRVEKMIYPSIKNGENSVGQTRVKVMEGAPVSSGYVAAKTDDGRGIAFHFLILNDSELPRATSLNGWRQQIASSNVYDQAIKAQVARTFRHPDPRTPAVDDSGDEAGPAPLTGQHRLAARRRDKRGHQERRVEVDRRAAAIRRRST